MSPAASCVDAEHRVIGRGKNTLNQGMCHGIVALCTTPQKAPKLPDTPDDKLHESGMKQRQSNTK
jgi:hypothetical protein